jgi:hypothetical protein
MVVFSACIMGCTPKVESWFYTKSQFNSQVPESYEDRKTYRKGKAICRDQLNYIPDTNRMAEFPMRYVRVNFHWMNTPDKTFSLKEDQGFREEDAIEYTRGFMHACNYDLIKNRKLWLPHNNDIPVLPINYRLVLSGDPDDPKDDGIYFHYDDELYYYVDRGKNSNQFDREVFKKYAVQPDTVLNIFVLPHHPDSVASKTYPVNRVGIALGTYVKVSGIYGKKGSFWDYRGLINHEIGHVFSLMHTWKYNDGCEDTVRHPGDCYSPNSRPGCDTLTSNNMMDYGYLQHALSPCQIGKVHKTMSNWRSPKRKLLAPVWCQLKEDSTLVIRDSIDWKCDKDIEGNIIIEAGAQLTLHCRLSLPSGAKIVVKPGAKLVLDDCWLHNDCGEQWLGIEIQESKNIKGEVITLGNTIIEDVANGNWDGS